ncbi:DNA cytosine methyltransferase [Pseudomonas putida]|uniref:DNA cytosine methyltransferase n=1 Tax=Pseudomonas putida TaxID=303 RepID=UPI0023643B9F|nr:DNA cytosine methyltransferase [Pseudomonas putida]EKT4479058.1 DNA cytosine methyltransferase [Pseudomonas putida]MDD2141312.1 DNA cytosine methyltransferase [Pseudomonas putida]HDS1723607.1 DNA cytosine methyltransferase [Pseudomonas putida]
MSAYYNEIDQYAAQWLRNLIAAGHIAPGDVDERSIEDVHPDDLKPYTQCHFFAGVGVWSYALRRAGWPDDRPVWTGSCPCQPFSSAGQGDGFDDKRHLWPHFHWLISERQPAIVFGEQVASKDAEPWLDLVQADVEAMAYAFGAIAFPSAGVGAPHIRDRTYWVAHANSYGRKSRGKGRSTLGYRATAESDRSAGRLGHPDHQGLEGHAGNDSSAGWNGPSGPAPAASVPVRLANPSGNGWGQSGRNSSCGSQAHIQGPTDQHGNGSPVNGIWRDADWLFCRDGKWRPVEPGTFPLAHGATSRVGRLRAYGNAINAEAATQFIAAYLESI